MKNIFFSTVAFSFVAGLLAAHWTPARVIFPILMLAASLAMFRWLARAEESPEVTAAAAPAPASASAAGKAVRKFQIWCAGIESAEKIIELFDDVTVEPNAPDLDVRLLVTSKSPDRIAETADKLTQLRPDVRDKTHFAQCDLFGPLPWNIQTRFDFIKLSPEYAEVSADDLQRVQLSLQLALSSHGMMTGDLIATTTASEPTVGAAGEEFSKLLT